MLERGLRFTSQRLTNKWTHTLLTETNLFTAHAYLIYGFS